MFYVGALQPANVQLLNQMHSLQAHFEGLDPPRSPPWLGLSRLWLPLVVRLQLAARPHLIWNRPPSVADEGNPLSWLSSSAWLQSTCLPLYPGYAGCGWAADHHLGEIHRLRTLDSVLLPWHSTLNELLADLDARLPDQPLLVQPKCTHDLPMDVHLQQILDGMAESKGKRLRYSRSGARQRLSSLHLIDAYLQEHVRTAATTAQAASYGVLHAASQL